MAIRFRCENCNTLLSIASRQAGKLVACPGCGHDLTVPAEDESSSSSAADASELEEQPDGMPGPDDRRAAAESADEFGQGPGLRQDSSPGDPDEPGQAEQPVAAPLAGEDDGGFALRQVKSEFGEMDLTPMVDVTFLLLIFFMVTASFSLQKSIEVPRPDPDQEGKTQSIESPEDLQENSVIVKIDEENAITVDGDAADPDNLLDLLLTKRRDEQKNDLVIDAHEQAKHGTVVLVNDAAVEAEFQHIRLAVRAAGSN